MAQIINLTPHDITFFASDGQPLLTVVPSSQMARVTTEVVAIGDINGIPVTLTQFGKVEGLPEPQEGTVFVVSSLVAQQVPEREDVFVPSDAVRDEGGRIIGCRALGRVR